MIMRPIAIAVRQGLSCDLIKSATRALTDRDTVELDRVEGFLYVFDKYPDNNTDDHA